LLGFLDDIYLQKYITSTKLKSKDIKVLYRDGKPLKTSKTNKKNLQQTVEKDDSGSGGGHRRNTKNLDIPGPINALLNLKNDGKTKTYYSNDADE
jgi:hypothetical protein